MAGDITEPKLLPHHEQQDLCSTRLPYRQGSKLTAVKVYTVNNESRHLLIFGVPSLNLRQETKSLCSRFGRLQLNITKYPSEQFTETYHAIYEDIQAARMAKKMLDTKNFYGGVLHVCYAPELDSLNDTRAKLLQRRQTVVNRLNNLQKSTVTKNTIIQPIPEQMIVQKDEEVKKLYMGNEHNIGFGKRKADFDTVKHCKLKKKRNFDRKNCVAVTENAVGGGTNDKEVQSAKVTTAADSVCDIVDFTSTESEVLTNINESLNYNNFGKELIRPVPYKPVNKIKFYLNKNL
ncbi:hypothetical protein PYW07_012984 [Mythimna separata]|uniref:RNA-binding protein 48 n=1 Tax=Mythimna separata TaxID=271217 RepID=A0AAD7Y9D6_MYTSE|nr:hypothetical protein PYW07_012984 [Mythimna separata]